jgi:sarcosine oxidase/L-pipecolate oxidase
VGVSGSVGAKCVSVPRTMMTPGVEEDMIPGEMVRQLRQALREVYLELADRPFVKTRLCWCV